MFDIKALVIGFFYKYAKPLIDSGYIYLGQAPLYKIKQGKKEIFLKDKFEYADFLKKLIDKVYKFAYKKDTKLYKLNSSELLKYMDDLEIMKNMATRYNTTIEIMDDIINLSSTKLKKKYPSLNISDDKIVGFIGNDFLLVLLNSQFDLVASQIKDIYTKFNKNIYYKENDSALKATTLFTILNEVLEKMTPKSLKRFKGLGRLICPLY